MMISAKLTLPYGSLLKPGYQFTNVGLLSDFAYLMHSSRRRQTSVHFDTKQGKGENKMLSSSICNLSRFQFAEREQTEIEREVREPPSSGADYPCSSNISSDNCSYPTHRNLNIALRGGGSGGASKTSLNKHFLNCEKNGQSHHRSLLYPPPTFYFAAPPARVLLLPTDATRRSQIIKLSPPSRATLVAAEPPADFSSLIPKAGEVFVRLILY